MRNTNTTGITLFFVCAFFLILAFISFKFLITSIIPVIGLINFILIPIALKFCEYGIDILIGLIKVLLNLDKLIEKDN